MADKLDYMPFVGRDFYDDQNVILMTDKQECWYMRLLWSQWLHGSVPSDDISLRKVASPEFGTKAKEWQQFLDKLNHEKVFPPIDEYRRQNPKLEELRAIVVGAAERRMEKASLASRTRWAKQKDMLEDKPKDMPEDMLPDAKGEGGRGKGVGKGKKNPSPPFEGRTTWITPYCNAWVERMGDGSESPAGRIAKALKKVHDEYGPELVAIRFRYYLMETKPEFCSPEKFAQTFGQWDGEAPALGAEYGFDD